MYKIIIRFFDKLEDKIRARLSRTPILYALIGGVGMVLFWRGVWHTADFATYYLSGERDFTLLEIVDGPISFAVGTIILLITGVYVSAFIGNKLIISGLNGDKKLAEKTKEEILAEEEEIKKIQKTLERVEQKIEELELESKN